MPGENPNVVNKGFNRQRADSIVRIGPVTNGDNGPRPTEVTTISQAPAGKPLSPPPPPPKK